MSKMISIPARVLQVILFISATQTSFIDAFTSISMQRHATVGGFSTSTARFAMMQNHHARSKRGARGNNKNALVMMPNSTPMVPYQPPGAEYSQFVDIYSRLYRERIMLIGNFIDEEAANNIISILLYLRKESKDEKITLYFNVPGALLRPALAVYDVIQQCAQDCEISTLNLGLASGMGAFLCGAGTKGLRCSMPNARFLLQRTGMEKPFQGQASDIGLEVQNLKKANDRMETELAKMTGHPISKIRQDLKRDFYLSSEEAVAYGLIDYVLVPDSGKGYKEIQWERDPWTGEKVMVPEKEVDLGNFEGEDVQRYQDQKGGGWGTGWKAEDREGFLGDEDDFSGNSGGNAGKGGSDGDEPYEPPTE